MGSAVDTEAYLTGCQKLCVELGLLDHVVFVGSVSQAELCTYYRLASAYLCLSEHEGFCVPLLEAMHFEVPVVAYAAAGVPGTMGEAGLLVQEKDFPAIAELVHRAIHDPALRAAVVAGQRAGSGRSMPRRSAPPSASTSTPSPARGGPMTAPPTRLRLALVVQRYGPEIDGGAEYECRRVAEALASHHDVDVLTTCARTTSPGGTSTRPASRRSMGSACAASPWTGRAAYAPSAGTQAGSTRRRTRSSTRPNGCAGRGRSHRP